jgi:hypothetical protein
MTKKRKKTTGTIKRLTERIEVLERRIDRIVAAIDKSKSVRGL